jgi:sulfite exporter TauE/SafE
MAAATAPSMAESALAMGAFGVGTMPALIVAAFGGKALELRYPLVMRKVTQGMMVWSGVWLFAVAGMILL